jgi:hypothetical protein
VGWRLLQRGAAARAQERLPGPGPLVRGSLGERLCVLESSSSSSSDKQLKAETEASGG